MLYSNRAGANTYNVGEFKEKKNDVFKPSND
jgi:hypothetical protein